MSKDDVGVYVEFDIEVYVGVDVEVHAGGGGRVGALDGVDGVGVAGLCCCWHQS